MFLELNNFPIFLESSEKQTLVCATRKKHDWLQQRTHEMESGGNISRMTSMVTRSSHKTIAHMAEIQIIFWIKTKINIEHKKMKNYE